MKNLYLLLIVLTTLSCTDKKTYTYIQINNTGNGIKKDEPILLKFENDSLAYAKFYENFYLYERVARGLKEKDPSFNRKPLKFFLFNPKGELLANPISTENRDNVHKIIEKRIDSIYELE